MPNISSNSPNHQENPMSVETPTFPNKNVVSFTKVDMPYGWLGNMSSEFGSIKYEGETYKTGEHLFQCLRYPKDLELLDSSTGEMINVRDSIRDQNSPIGAKRKSGRTDFREHRYIEKYSSDDLDLMLAVLRIKMEQAREDKIRRKLIYMGLEAVIVEDTTDRGRKQDTFWGAVKIDDNTWKGFNHLGRLWMILKAEVIAADKANKKA